MSLLWRHDQRSLSKSPSLANSSIYFGSELISDKNIAIAREGSFINTGENK